MKEIYCFEIDNIQYKNYKNKSANIFLIENDKSSQKLSENTYILFEKKLTENKNLSTNTIILCYVKNIYYFSTIIEAITSLGTKNCGFSEKMSIEQISDMFLNNKKIERIEKLGIIAVEFEVKK